jgi:hypothetical protein
MPKVDSRPITPGQKKFEGTEVVVQNQRVAVKRIVEFHSAMELQHQAESKAEAQRNDSARMSSDCLDFDAIDLHNGEVRAFWYLLRKWDREQSPEDPEFELAVEATETDSNFDEAAIKHFIRRVALWDESEEMMQATQRELEQRAKKDKKRGNESMLGKLWAKERGSQDPSMHDELKQVTTREGLAQLLYALMRNPTAPLAPELFAECTEAVKKYGYGITS